MSIETVSNILIEELSDIYCYNCENNGKNDACDFCHRKNMYWQLSKKAAEQIAERIINAK